jgi:hypothetical protein
MAFLQKKATTFVTFFYGFVAKKMTVAMLSHSSTVMVL